MTFAKHGRFPSLYRNNVGRKLDEVSKLVPGADVKALMGHIAVVKEQIDCGEIDPHDIDFEQEAKALTSASE
jgi:hypothetical protein